MGSLNMQKPVDKQGAHSILNLFLSLSTRVFQSYCIPSYLLDEDLQCTAHAPTENQPDGSRQDDKGSKMKTDLF